MRVAGTHANDHRGALDMHFSIKYKAANPDNKNVAEVGKAGGLEWASIGAAAKAKYEDQAAQDKAKFAKDYPDYKPAPRAKKAKEGEAKAAAK